SVLHTGAHPDDEDSAFIARTARGDNARVGYLSLTRGEGGQNIIGPELFDALGVIRTEELLQARRLDGGEQFFSRAFDYGFSKTLTEAKSKWNEREILGDMVRVIRLFRPLVVHSRFAGNEIDGHGQHQFAGYLTPLAYKAAADPNQYSEQIAEGLRPGQPRARTVRRATCARGHTGRPPIRISIPNRPRKDFGRGSRGSCIEREAGAQTTRSRRRCRPASSLLWSARPTRGSRR